MKYSAKHDLGFYKCLTGITSVVMGSPTTETFNGLKALWEEEAIQPDNIIPKPFCTCPKCGVETNGRCCPDFLLSLFGGEDGLNITANDWNIKLECPEGHTWFVKINKSSAY